MTKVTGVDDESGLWKEETYFFQDVWARASWSDGRARITNTWLTSTERQLGVGTRITKLSDFGGGSSQSCQTPPCNGKAGRTTSS
jgi:hypothetical protein